MNLRSLRVLVVKKPSSEELTTETQRSQRNARRKINLKMIDWCDIRGLQQEFISAPEVSYKPL